MAMVRSPNTSFGGLVAYDVEANVAFDCPGHQGGQFYRKSPAGQLFFKHFGEAIFRNDLCNADVDLGDLVKQGRFREDLFHRLNVIALQLPPLRDRKEDIPLLVDHAMRRYCEENGKGARRFSASAMKVLMDYDWPGNVRELENVVERAVVLSSSDVMDVDLLPDNLRSKEIVKGVRLQLSELLPASASSPDKPAPSLFDMVEEVERHIILDMLERTNWNQTEAAERFRVPLSTLNQKIKRLGIETRRRSNRTSNGGNSMDDTADIIVR